MSRFGRFALLAPPALLVALAALSVIGASSVPLSAAAPADVPKLSTFAPMDVLVAEADELIGNLDKSVASESDYKKQKKVAERDAYILAIVAHAISQHDKKEEAKWGANAAAVRDAAKAFVSAEKFADAQGAINRIKDLVAGGATNGDVQAVEWNQLVPLKELMPVVNKRNLLLRRDLRTGKPRKRDESIRNATMIALFTRTVREDYSDVEKSEDHEKWTQFADDARDQFAGIAQMLREQKDGQLKEAVKAGSEACNACHKVFRPDIK